MTVIIATDRNPVPRYLPEPLLCDTPGCDGEGTYVLTTDGPMNLCDAHLAELNDYSPTIEDGVLNRA